MCFVIFLVYIYWSRVIVKYICIFFFKQKTAYELRISDCSSVVCSSDLFLGGFGHCNVAPLCLDAGSVEGQINFFRHTRGSGYPSLPPKIQIGRASCRERVCTYV